MNLENIKRIQLLQEERMKQRYECFVCGTKDLSFRLVRLLNYTHFNNGSPDNWVSMDGKYGMVVCSEACRKAFVASGLVPYRASMQEDIDGTFVLPERHLRDPYCRLENWENSPNDNYRNKFNHINNWLQKPITHGWLLLGNVGAGKTSLACAIAYELRKLEKKVKFVYGSELTDEIKVQDTLRSWDIPEQRSAFFDKYMNNDLLIIDEIAHMDWKSSIANTLLTKLHSEMKVVVFTANLTPEQTKDKMDAPLYSRLIQMTKPMSFMGDDFVDFRK